MEIFYFFLFPYRNQWIARKLYCRTFGFSPGRKVHRCGDGGGKWNVSGVGCVHCVATVYRNCALCSTALSFHVKTEADRIAKFLSAILVTFVARWAQSLLWIHSSRACTHSHRSSHTRSYRQHHVSVLYGTNEPLTGDVALTSSLKCSDLHLSHFTAYAESKRVGEKREREGKKEREREWDRDTNLVRLKSGNSNLRNWLK